MRRRCRSSPSPTRAARPRWSRSAAARGGPDRRRGAREHAGARERRVEAARQEGRPARRDRRRHAPALRRVAETPPVSRPRVIAVCGYSDGRVTGPARDLRGAPSPRRAGGRRRRHRPPLRLGAARERRVGGGADGRGVDARRAASSSSTASARSTFANVRAAARVAREADASEVVLVTSGWHGRRAAALLRAALRGPGTAIRLATTDEPPSVSTRLRELACWTVVPLARLSASASRR